LQRLLTVTNFFTSAHAVPTPTLFAHKLKGSRDLHLHISALNGVIVALYVIAIMGALNLLAMKYADGNKLAASYANLFGLS
jgi:hypothetical protein